MWFKNHTHVSFNVWERHLCGNFYGYPLLKFHTKYLTYTFKETHFIVRRKFKSSYSEELVSLSETVPWTPGQHEHKEASTTWTTFQTTFCCIKMDHIQIQISLQFLPKCSIDNTYKSALLQQMAWCQTDRKSLPEPMRTKIYDAIWHH